jgi:hypothetical protein
MAKSGNYLLYALLQFSVTFSFPPLPFLNMSLLSKTLSISKRGHAALFNHKTRSAPSFISWACAVDLSKRD